MRHSHINNLSRKIRGSPDIDHANNRVQLEAYVYPVLGALPVTAVAREQGDAVMRRLPTHLSRNSRRHVAKIVIHVLNLAELAGYIERNPLPKGWVPKPGTRKDTPVLFPAEDAALLASADVPLLYRLFYGFVHREGGRRTEAARLQWYELDLKNGVVQLDQNKTEHARWWKMGDGVADALRVWRMVQGWPEDTALVFQDGEGGLNVDHMSSKVQKHLKAAKVSRVRLFTKGTNTLRFGTHAFRHSFTTRNLALGKTDDWVRTRTGHTSNELLRYRETARSLEELELGRCGSAR